MIPRQDHIDLITAVIKKAGASVMDIYRKGGFSVAEKADSSPVTQADLQSEAIITDGLATLTPGVAVISEESVADPSAKVDLPDDYWIVDPLDGTREFIKGNDEFCICLARVTGKIVTEGYIFSPPSGILWYAARDYGAYRVIGGITEKLPLTGTAGAIRVLKSRSHTVAPEKDWIARLSGQMDVAEEYQGSAIKFGRLSDGSGDLYIKMSTIFKWDVAAGSLLVEESGGNVTSLSNLRRLDFGTPGYTVDPFIASGYRVGNINSLLKILPPF